MRLVSTCWGDARELCVALGYSSLFAYCTEALGFCKSSAGPRIAAARVCRDFPEAFTHVANGELQLSVLCALRPHLNAENARELFAASARKSYEQVEVLLAARFPKPDVRDLIRRLPERESTPDIDDIGSEAVEGQKIEKSEKAALDATTSLVPLELLQVRREASRAASTAGAVKPRSVDRFSVNFTAESEFRELLEEVKALLSHSEPKGELLTVMKRGLEALRGELLKKRFGVGRKARRMISRKRESSKPPRHVPAAVAREVCCVTTADAHSALRMDGVAASGGCCSSIT
jgi:hypothetical protein